MSELQSWHLLGFLAFICCPFVFLDWVFPSHRRFLQGAGMGPPPVERGAPHIASSFGTVLCGPDFRQRERESGGWLAALHCPVTPLPMRQAPCWDTSCFSRLARLPLYLRSRGLRCRFLAACSRLFRCPRTGLFSSCSSVFRGPF